MKRQLVIIFLAFYLGISCGDDNNLKINSTNPDSAGTIIGKRVVYQNGGKIREAIYFLVTDSDTSDLRYDISYTSSGEVEVIVYYDDISKRPRLSYREEMDELKQVLGKAKKDFELRALKKIWDVSLLVTGDLAIAITKQLPADFSRETLNNLDVGNFLLTSKITDDLNEVLKPYGKKIKRYVVEKARFLDSSIIFKYNKIETPRSEIPAEILDANIWPVVEAIDG